MASRRQGANCPQYRREIRGRFDELEPDYVLIAGLVPAAEDHTNPSGDVGKVI